MTATSAGTSGLDLAPGRIVGDRYRVDRLIGRGGMSSVFAATDTQLGREVALKVFRAELAAGDGMRRHRDEVDLLAGLNHPALVTLFDAVDGVPAPGGAALVLELVDGDDLGRMISRGRLPHDQVAVIGATIAEALAHIHARGIIHRDVKPGNILVPATAEGETAPRAKLVDFGIARLVDADGQTGTGAVLGTVHYLSPEQALGSAVEPPSDIYSLALVLLEALTGRRAFDAAGVEAAAARVTRDPAIPHDMHVGWGSLLGRMSARDPDDRPTALEVADELRGLADVPALPEIDDDSAATVATPVSAPASTAEVAIDDEATGAMPEPTRILPPVEQRTTGVIGGAGRTESAARAADATRPHESRRPFGLRGRLARVVLGAAAAIAVVSLGVAGVALATSLTAGNSSVKPAVEYPSVPGELGDNLERLQRSVTP
ncbi:serine/threonine protein kinase [Microcella alkaliphila]|uniref:non-specific serine/threonine protein kinase n=1 Tax=Microcella alkaliphila TaxID=279828 RepID=A0A4Q7TFB7_9MICO|nr:serine/threonine-protein kinase [Microcella alkaliphila]RZT59195.1 serine/threonine protein kinase [Microcella alkaliphila]